MKAFTYRIRTLVCLIIISIVTLSAVGCSGGSSSITGVYQNVDGEILVFASDNSMRIIKGSEVSIGTYSTSKDDIELAYRGIAQKFGYSLKDKQLILYSSGTTNSISTGVVFEKVGDSTQSASRSEAGIASVVGIFEDRANMLAGNIIDKAYVFREDGTFRHLEYPKSKNGTYTIDGNKLILKTDDLAEVWYAEIRNGDLVLFEASNAYSDGKYFCNVSEKYMSAEEKYQNASELVKTEQFEDAMNAFLSIKEYWDSDVLGSEAGYKAALGMYEKNEYRAALNILNKLENFDDYRSISDDCRRKVAGENVEYIKLAATSKRNSSEPSANYRGHVFEFSVDITNGSPDEIKELQGTMNIYNNSDNQLISVSIYNGDGIKPEMTRTIRFTVDAERSAGSEELFNTILENLTIRFILDSVSFEGTTYTNINKETVLREAAAVITTDSTSVSSTITNNSGTQVTGQSAAGDSVNNSTDGIQKYAGVYESDEAVLTIEPDGRANVSIYRLTSMDGTAANPINGIIPLSLEDASGKLLKMEFDTYSKKLTVTASTWAYLNNGDSFILEKQLPKAYSQQYSYSGGYSNSDYYNDEYMIYGSDQRYISNADLAGFGAWECRVARNEIFARHGRLFQSEDLQRHFNSKSWYYGTIPADSFNDNVLNQFEKANISTIQAYEKSKGYN